jgi:uncharacterized membrane protein YdjX (TVP38/TMEM64 family)/rhodanese-related sulfurtransferase
MNKGASLKPAVRVALSLALVGGIVLVYVYRDLIDTETLERWAREAGVSAPLLFMTIYALGTVLFFPGSVLTLAGGAIFGPVWGTIYNLIGATVGATLAFLAARYLAQNWVARRSGGFLKKLLDGVDAEGWKFVAFVRLVPLFPFNLLNYALGLTRIRLGHYVLASCVFMLPGAIAYTYLGYAGREAVTGGEGLIQKGLLALALLALVAFLPRLLRRLRTAPVAIQPTLDVVTLKQRLDRAEKIAVLDVRSHEEYHGPLGHIAGARHIPLPELAQRHPELAQLENIPIAVVCRTDRRAAEAIRQLSAAGYTQLWLVSGGMEAWGRNRFPVVF